MEEVEFPSTVRYSSEDDEETGSTTSSSESNTLIMCEGLGDELIEVDPTSSGMRISPEVGIQLILSLVTKHSLTYSALADILSVIRLHLPENSIPTAYNSVYHLMKSMCSLQGDSQIQEVVHRLCGNCHSYLPGSQPCENLQCHDTEITFIELPVDAQIQALFKGIYRVITITLNAFIHIYITMML